MKISKDVQFKTYKNFVGELTATYKRSSVPATQITSSMSAEEFIRPYFESCMDDHEEFKIIHLNNSNNVLNVDAHSIGGMTGTIIDKRLVFRNVLLSQSVAIMLVHNHPSGALKPSEADKKITKEIKEAAKLLDITLLDHIIITRESYYSFADDYIL